MFLGRQKSKKWVLCLAIAGWKGDTAAIEPQQYSAKPTLLKKHIRKTRAGNWLICSSLIRSFAHLFILLKSNERLWAICSDHSRKMSDYERIPQVEQMSNSLKKCCLKNLKSYFLVCFIKVFFFKKWSICSFPRFLVSNVSKSLRSLIKNELCERITQVGPSPKMSDVSRSLRSLTKNERMSELLF